MRVPAVLGFLVALLVGFVALGVIFLVIGNQPPIAATLDPLVTPSAMAPLPPTPSPSPTTAPATPTGTPQAGETDVPAGTAIGQRPPSFELPHLGGGTIGTEASIGKPLWVNFMATWCPECEDELPMMAQLSFDVGDAMDMLLVDVGESGEAVNDFMTRLGVELPVALDQNGAVQEEWSAFALPVHFWLDRNGVVQEIVYGGAPREVFEAAVLKVVPEASFTAP